MPLYTGQCHCGTVKFQIDLPEPISSAKRCNCSLCSRKGALMGMAPVDRLTVTQGEDNLGLYQWNTRVARHYFCKTCGIYTHHQRRTAPDIMGFNLGCVDNLDMASIAQVDDVDGAALSLE